MQIPMLAQESSWHVVLGPMVAKQSNVILGANVPSCCEGAMQVCVTVFMQFGLVEVLKKHPESC